MIVSASALPWVSFCAVKPLDRQGPSTRDQALASPRQIIKTSRSMKKVNIERSPNVSGLATECSKIQRNCTTDTHKCPLFLRGALATRPGPFPSRLTMRRAIETVSKPKKTSREHLWPVRTVDGVNEGSPQCLLVNKLPDNVGHGPCVHEKTRDNLVRHIEGWSNWCHEDHKMTKREFGCSSQAVEPNARPIYIKKMPSLCARPHPVLRQRRARPASTQRTCSRLSWSREGGTAAKTGVNYKKMENDDNLLPLFRSPLSLLCDVCRTTCFFVRHPIDPTKGQGHERFTASMAQSVRKKKRPQIRRHSALTKGDTQRRQRRQRIILHPTTGCRIKQP